MQMKVISLMETVPESNESIQYYFLLFLTTHSTHFNFWFYQHWMNMRKGPLALCQRPITD